MLSALEMPRAELIRQYRSALNLNLSAIHMGQVLTTDKYNVETQTKVQTSYA